MNAPMPKPLPEAEPEAKVTIRTKVPPKYEAIMRYIAANPAFTIQEVARQFGTSAGWMASVLNSDLFIARFQEFMAELDDKMLLPQLVDKVKGVTALALERLGTVLENTGSEDAILKATDILLKATKPPAQVTNINTQGGPTQVNLSVDPRLVAIQQARREALGAASGQALPVTTIADVAEAGVPADIALSGRLEVIPPTHAVEFIEAEVRQQQVEEVLRPFDDKGAKP